MCEGYYDNITGCYGPNSCSPKTSPGNNGILCPGYCPMICTTDQIYCPGKTDINTGCKEVGTCVPADEQCA